MDKNIIQITLRATDTLPRPKELRLRIICAKFDAIFRVFSIFMLFSFIINSGYNINNANASEKSSISPSIPERVKSTKVFLLLAPAALSKTRLIQAFNN